jgi:hypothetical protein
MTPVDFASSYIRKHCNQREHKQFIAFDTTARVEIIQSDEILREMDLLKIVCCVILAALAMLSGTTGQQAGGDQTSSITSTIPMRENPCPDGYVLVREKCKKVASRRCVDIHF